MKQLGFFYFFGSGYAYLSVMRIDASGRTKEIALAGALPGRAFG